MLEARDLWVAPPGARDPVVRGQSLSIERGEWVAFAGPNGGGKSTLLHALAGLWPPTRGQVTLDGAPLVIGSDARRKIAVVLQDPSSQLLQPTVADELSFAGRNLDLDPSRLATNVARLARTLGLEPELERDPVSLSAGRQQLVLIASALAAEPEVLLADEPTAHLDQDTRARVLELFNEERRSGLAVGWATQDTTELDRASRVVRIGDDLPDAMPLPRKATGGARRGEVLLAITISPAAAGSDRCVRVSERREVLVRQGEITALVGPNAAGKSLLIQLAAGLEALDQVRVSWVGRSDPPPIVALQYPELQIFEELVEDELIFAAVSRGISRSEAKAHAASLLDSLGLESSSFLARRTWSLSTGEKRLIGLIGALISPASLVALDEPTAGLDPQRRERVARLLNERAAADPVLVATQDEDWLSRLGAASVRIG
jgi:energy-coupling factor transport system ATP-binding protein